MIRSEWKRAGGVDQKEPAINVRLPTSQIVNLFFGTQIDPYSVRSKATLRQREPDKIGPAPVSD